mmetsp:Transcript_46895/g.73403  ORF Transcript_46895/g.73403 Transcript_46895/m.73403 type:complete len:148 (-) Transcript_46895:1069-1512(-)
MPGICPALLDSVREKYAGEETSEPRTAEEVYGIKEIDWTDPKAILALEAESTGDGQDLLAGLDLGEVLSKEIESKVISALSEATEGRIEEVSQSLSRNLEFGRRNGHGSTARRTSMLQKFHHGQRDILMQLQKQIRQLRSALDNAHG